MQSPSSGISGTPLTDSVGVIELHLDQSGKGTGVVFSEALIGFDEEGTLNIEYVIPPYRIPAVEVR